MSDRWQAILRALTDDSAVVQRPQPIREAPREDRWQAILRALTDDGAPVLAPSPATTCSSAETVIAPERQWPAAGWRELFEIRLTFRRRHHSEVEAHLLAADDLEELWLQRRGEGCDRHDAQLALQEMGIEASGTSATRAGTALDGCW
jgi:hypothetical protein